MKALISLTLLLAGHSAYGFTFGCSNCSELLGWQQDELVFEINPTDCPSDINSDIEKAFEVWNSVSTSGIELKLGAETTDTVATIVDRVDSNPVAHAPVIACDSDFQNTFSLSDAETDGILGLASFNTVSGLEIKTAYLILNAESGASANINDQDNTSRQIVIAHEIGHALGLGHSSEESALMFFNIGEKANLNLHQDDADGLSYLYPRSEPSDGIYGCGSILAKGGGSPPPPSPFVLALFLLPLALYAQKRRRPANVDYKA